MDLTNAPVVVTVGAIHGGVRSNIIPESVYMLGTIRTFDVSMKKQVHERIRKIVQTTAEANNATATIDINNGYPVTYNDPELYNEMFPTFERIAGKENVNIIKAVTGAEFRDGYESLNMSNERLDEIGIKGMVAPFSISCENHEGAGKFAVMQWDGEKFNQVTDWEEPLDPAFIRSLVENSAAKFAEENNITPKDCNA